MTAGTIAFRICMTCYRQSGRFGQENLFCPKNDDDDDDDDHCARCRAGVAIPVIGYSGSDIGRGVLLVKIWAEDFADFFRIPEKL